MISKSLNSFLPPPLSSCSRGSCSSVPPCHTETQKKKQKHRKNTKQLPLHCPAAAEWGVPPCQTHRKRKKQKQEEKLSLSSSRITCFKYILLHHKTHTHTEKVKEAWSSCQRHRRYKREKRKTISIDQRGEKLVKYFPLQVDEDYKNGSLSNERGGALAGETQKQVN